MDIPSAPASLGAAFVGAALHSLGKFPGTYTGFVDRRLGLGWAVGL